MPLMRVLPRRRVDAMTSAASLAGVARQLDPVGPPPGLPDWRCVAAPGHTPGHAAFFRARDRVLIAGDAVLTVNLNSVRGLTGNSHHLEGSNQLPPAARLRGCG
jgi:glyoxylase-like metal-dependent hydrolase (beta-lactamase superfamily II)